jgi:hypothetical protein
VVNWCNYNTKLIGFQLIYKLDYKMVDKIVYVRLYFFKVEISTEGVLLMANGVDGHILKEITQLDNDEVYRLFIVLQEWFREEREKECNSLSDM